MIKEKTAQELFTETNILAIEKKFNQLYGRVWNYINETVKRNDKYVDMIIANQDEEDMKAATKVEHRLNSLGFDVELLERSGVLHLIVSWKTPKKNTVEPEEINDLEDLI